MRDVRPRPLQLVALFVLAAALTISCGISVWQARMVSEARYYLDAARRTRDFSLRQLAFPAGGTACGSGEALSFARAVGSRLSDQWYLAIQLQADAAFIPLADFSVTCDMISLVDFMTGLQRPDYGFYPRADVDGQNTTTRDTYADDNAVIGLAFLEAREATTDVSQRDRLLTLARSAGDYLLEGGLWDSTFGGGYWWYTNRGLMREGKPTQTNAAAAELFLRLYLATNDVRYLDQALQTLAWLDATTYDPRVGLYRLGIRHSSTADQTGTLMEDRYFGYDQAIAIEVNLLLGRIQGQLPERLAKAQSLGRALHAAFWDPELGGYRLERDVDAVYTPYAAWVSQALLHLYDEDGDPVWLAWARDNVDALNSRMLDTSDGGYYHMTYRCTSPDVIGCESGQAWSYDPTKLLFSQAWMQRAQALLAERLDHRVIDPS
ncbi:MAG: hypothetical protein IT307_03755 [Chloroflexi bacterium]|nr:hypothetical protein [Chloroflexota bacterium]